MINKLLRPATTILNFQFTGLFSVFPKNGSFSELIFKGREVRFYSKLIEKSSYSDDTKTNVEFSKFDEENEQCETRLLKVAIIGVPNAGKSTVINQLVGRRVCSISSKVHTTRCKARAIAVHENTQLVFLDTPGLVTSSESQRHHLEHKFHVDSEMAMLEADIIGVIHDVSNIWAHHRLDPKVLRLLHLYPRKNSFLIVNKIDTLKSKRRLLDIIRNLTKDTLKNPESSNNRRQCQQQYTSENEEEMYEHLSEQELQKRVMKEKGWPNFREIFMISALNGEGTEDVKDYLLHLAEPSPWLYPPTQFTDQPSEMVIVDTVRAKLLDNLPQEIPYNLNIVMEYFDYGEEGTISAVVLVGCSSVRLEKLLIGSRGMRIRMIARSAEQELQKTFLQPVRLKVVVTSKNKTVNPLFNENQ